MLTASSIHSESSYEDSLNIYGISHFFTSSIQSDTPKQSRKSTKSEKTNKQTTSLTIEINPKVLEKTHKI